MGFHRRYISEQTTLHYLYRYDLDGLYGKADAIIFMDEFSSKVYKMFGKINLKDYVANIVKNS